jgi:hypothetical protein
MNKLVRISTSLLLSFIILVGGSGLIIGKMVCLKSGHVLISANEAKDCCKDEKGKTEFNDQCCDISNFSFQHQQFVGQNQLVVKASSVSSAILLPEFLVSSATDLHSTSQFSFPSDPPELIPGSQALPLLCIFRI